jgi:toxin CcdB
MAQFTVYRNQNPDSKTTYPYFVDVQNDLLESLNSRLVVPVTRQEHLGNSNISNLCLKITINDDICVMLTHQMTTVPLAALKVPVSSLAHLRNDIVAAIDFLITGI